MTNTYNDISTWRGKTVVGAAGDKIGKITEIYLDDQTGRPEWLSVKTGLFGNASSFVPLEGARLVDDNVAVPYEKSQVKDAPNVEDDGDGHLSLQEEERLFRHYGRTGTRQAVNATQGRDTSGPTTDDAMTRSEEELVVGTRRQEAGRARLRKWVETEQVTQTVPVAHEELRVEREPITEANIDAATSGPAISEEEHEIVLHEEEPVVEKRTVPKERVRLDKEAVGREAPVEAEVQKERIEVKGDR